LKEEARRIIEGLPDDATWEDLQYEVYVRQSIEAGLKAAREGRVVSVEEVRRRLGLASE
jgi:predicted transcriptional regulator